MAWSQAVADPCHPLRHPRAPSDYPYLSRLSRELFRFQCEDDRYSVKGLERSRVAGCTYEGILYQRLRNLNIPFKAEDDLRREGSCRTPDVLLTVPILVDGAIVHWIDSKAMYGDANS